MNFVLIGLTILFASMAAILAASLHLFKKNIRSLNKQMEFICKSETNMRLVTQWTDKDTNILINHINKMIDEHKRVEQQLFRTNKNFRESITSISHDLRTPLTSAGGYMQMLNNEALTEEDRKAYGGVVQERIETVQKLLNQLFEYARIEADEWELEKELINTTNLLYDTLSIYYNDFRSKNTEPLLVISKEAFFIKGDAGAVKRIFSNIIYNALIHGEDNYSIEAVETDAYYKYTFSNRTVSITEDDIVHIFDRFYTTDQSRTKKTTGLGLSIAKNLTLKMNGSINAYLKEDQFSITISFPKAKI